MATISMAYAKAHLPELVERVSKGERITISRYRKPVAELGPSRLAEKPKPKFGTGKGKVELIDPRALDPMTDEKWTPSSKVVISAGSVGHSGTSARLCRRCSAI